MINMPGDPFKYQGKHRKPAVPGKTIATIAAIAVPVTLAGTAMIGLTPLAAQASQHVSAQQQTCSAFAAWERHPTAANMRTLITDSLNAPWHKPGSKYGLGSDVYGLGGDVLAGKVRYVAKDARYVGEDCK